MTWSEGLDPVLVDYVYAHEVLRRLGFPSETLYLSATPQGHQKTLVALTIQQPTGMRVRQFVWTIGVAALTVEDTQRQYELAAERWNTGKETGTDHAAWKAWLASKGHVVELVATLQVKGFPVPDWPDVRELITPTTRH